MLTQMRFKNWRSLRDVTIGNLTPITVFIGANSSGKSNILDALHFVRSAKISGVKEAAFVWRAKEKLRALGVSEPIELELTYALKREVAIRDRYTISYAVNGPLDASNDEIIEPSLSPEKWQELRNKTYDFVTHHWQLLREGFLPPSSLPADTIPNANDLYFIQPMARNMPLMLNYMQQTNLEVYNKLQADLQLLLDYVSEVGTVSDDKETRYFLEENMFPDQEAPTIAGGTARIIAILTAYYALDMRNAELPGLVVIEEPDTGIHSLLLGNLVDLFRSYTEHEHLRQFILTTHNPQVLNFFEPREVHIVERDKDGITTVKPVDEKVAAVWREQEGAYNLGNLWTTRLIGGVP